jgi:hypothetical protein
MRTCQLVLLLACLAATGCAGGFRVGGNRFGAGVGAYIGPVPDAVKPERTDTQCYSGRDHPPLPR